MTVRTSDNRNAFLDIIESQQKINQRFSSIKRIDSNGGNGTFSLVFSAWDEIKKEEAILKFFNPAYNNNIDRLKRFHREGEVLVRLKGRPNIVKCIDGVCELPIPLTFGNTTILYNFLYIPLEKAISSFEEIISKGNLSPEKCLLYFKEMCKAVARVHNASVCHRDLKPGNFLIFKNDEIKLGDFGTAKFLDGSMDDIRDKYELPVGDINYIAPETFCKLGISDLQVFNADLFALGAIFFEMFTNQVLANYIYSDQNFVSSLLRLNQILPTRETQRVDKYLEIIDPISSSVKFPSIYDFDDYVPKSIKFFLDELYKDLTKINFRKRLSNFTNIYRRLDICMIILRNEEKYQTWRLRKEKMRKNTLMK